MILNENNWKDAHGNKIQSFELEDRLLPSNNIIRLEFINELITRQNEGQYYLDKDVQYAALLSILNKHTAIQTIK